MKSSSRFILPVLLLSAAVHTSAAPRVLPRRVIISGYDGPAMEPFVSRDGRYLLFNNLNAPSVNTDIHYASRQDEFTWIYRGRVDGINTPALEGCPTMDRTGQIFFVSPRDYPMTLCTIYRGVFQDGRVTGVQAVESISLKKPGMVNFDVEVSPDGQTLYFVDSRFLPLVGPLYADLVMASWDGRQFVRSPESARILGQINATRGLRYAPAISADAAFDVPSHVDGLGDFVEGAAFSPDERLLYFHRKDGDTFHLYAVPIP